VNVRWLIERMPGPTETDLVVLATPSAPFDPLALELYSRCIRDMPPGVPLSENPLGEWFANVLGKVSELAPVIGDAVGAFVPGASLIGKAVGAAARIGSGVASDLSQRPTPGSSSQMVPTQPTTATRKQKKKPQTRAQKLRQRNRG